MNDNDAPTQLVKTLRDQIADRVRGQVQTIIVAAVVAGASLSFAAKQLSSHPEVMALLALLYASFGLSVLRGDQEIAIIAEHLIDTEAFGSHADAQARWERHKFTATRGSGPAAWFATASQTIGIYAVPILGTVAFAWAAMAAPSPSPVTWLILGAAFALWFLCLLGAIDVVNRYGRLCPDEPESAGGVSEGTPADPREGGGGSRDDAAPPRATPRTDA